MDQFFNIALKPVLVKDLSNDLDFNLINREFDKLEFKVNRQNDISTNLNFFDQECFEKTRSILIKECENFLSNGYTVNEFEHLRITNSWGNITKVGESHHKHIHPFSIISGVLFLDNNPNNYNLNLEFYMPQTPYFLNRNDIFSSLRDLIPTENNNLKNHVVLFLSNTQHYVDEVAKGEQTRRTIAFNTFWQGKTGDGELGSIYFS
jgi:uncharacterized protein (TIGR02466 family)